MKIPIIRQIVRLLSAVTAVAAVFGSIRTTAEELSLIDDKNPTQGWRFDNGQEFPGAKGRISIDNDVEAQYRPALRLDADFSGGGNYVQAGCDLPSADLETLSFWLKTRAGTSQITIRVVDGSGQCHQFNLKIAEHGRWQRIIFPIEKYFANAGTSSSVEIVQRYEGWGGASDGKWHNPGKGLYILAARNVTDENGKGSLWISGAKIITAAPKTVLTREERLDDFLKEGELDWGYNDGREFPGAKGGVELVKNIDSSNNNAIHVRGDFSGGGAYIATEHNLNGLNIKSIRMKVRTPNMKSFNVRLGDGTGQCHQGRGIRLVPDNKWHDVVIDVRDVVGGEHWGGSNDGIWHGAAKYVSIIVNAGSSDDKKPEMFMTDICADVEVSASVAGEPWKENFEDKNTIPEDWSVAGYQKAAEITEESPFEGKHALRLSRPESEANGELKVTGAAFAAAPGPWSFSGATRSKLYSPDNSFAVRINVEALNSLDAIIDTKTIVDQTGNEKWRPFAKEVELPKNTVKARFAVTFHKTNGYCDIDNLSAVPLEIKGKEKIINRIEISGAAIGNLFFPEDEVKFTFRVMSSRPIPKQNREIKLTVTDYWGAEQSEPTTVELQRSGSVNGAFAYSAGASFPRDMFDIGKYYELHACITPEGYENAFEYSGFARLPTAESRKYDPEDIPFTIRNWDGRLQDYFKLASRIGHRTIGLWGNSGIDEVLAQGDVWYSSSAAGEVERNGFKNITEEQLAKNTADFIRSYGDKKMACLIMGNEPRETPELIPEKVRAYKIVYEAAKSVNPNIPVIATSVGANRDFFDAGFHKYCDVFDFHVYETYENVRQAIRKYKTMMKEYGVDKPIWCTELGLNSQGQTRLAVAQEVVKKITAFFAEGGANVSWFTIMYPDSDGKARGTSGNTHNTFDCQYNKYNPRLDAIMYYNMINGITIKKFVSERQYPDGVQSYLFRDDTGDCFQIMWKEGGRIDRSVPITNAGGDVKLIRIDGSSTMLSSRRRAVTLGLSEEPILLRYKQKSPAPLAEKLSEPEFSVTSSALSILKGGTRDIIITGDEIKAENMKAEVPARWTAKFVQNDKNSVKCIISAPEETDARSGRIMIRNSASTGEIILQMPIMSPVTVKIIAGVRNQQGEPTVRVTMQNNGQERASIDWTVELTDSFPMEGGSFTLNNPQIPDAYLKGDVEGRTEIDGGQIHEAAVSIADAAEQTIFRLRVTVTDSTGRKIVKDRLVAGFATAVRTEKPVVIDGKLSEDVWSKTTTQNFNLAEQNFRFSNTDVWKGLNDLSGTWRAAWDDKFLYLAVNVVDDIHSVKFSDGAVWNQDGLQFLFDPARTEDEKSGKYDYSLSNGTKGPQAWCHLTAHSSVTEGEAPFEIATSGKNPDLSGEMVYEVAIPWTSLAPFVPSAGSNLGMTIIINEDDGAGRVGFMGWFSGAHSKQLDLVGDLILAE